MAIAAQTSPASAPTANANWFTPCPASVSWSVAEAARGGSCAVHSLRCPTRLAPSDQSAAPTATALSPEAEADIRSGSVCGSWLEVHATSRAALDLARDPDDDHSVLAELDSAQHPVEAELAQRRCRVDGGLPGALIEGGDRAARTGFYQAQR